MFLASGLTARVEVSVGVSEALQVIPGGETGACMIKSMWLHTETPQSTEMMPWGALCPVQGAESLGLVSELV